MSVTNYDAHELKTIVIHDANGEPVNYVYAKFKVDRVIYAEKHKRSLLYAKNHALEAQKAQDAIRILRLNSKGFTKQQCDDFVAYWFKVRDNHVKHHAEWLKLAEYFKTKADEH